jgi:hypothetical protein
MMGKRQIYILKLSHAHFTLHYAQVTPSEQGIPEIIIHPWWELLTPQAFRQPPQLLTPGALLGNSSLLKRSLNQTSGTPHSWGVPWQLCTPKVFPYSKPGVTNKGG